MRISLHLPWVRVAGLSHHFYQLCFLSLIQFQVKTAYDWKNTNVFLEALGLIFLLPTRWKYCSFQCDIAAVVQFTWMKLSSFSWAVMFLCFIKHHLVCPSATHTFFHLFASVSKVEGVWSHSQHALRCQTSCPSCSTCKHCCPFFSKYYFLEIQSCLLSSQAVTGQISDLSKHNIFTLKKYLKS